MLHNDSPLPRPSDAEEANDRALFELLQSAQAARAAAELTAQRIGRLQQITAAFAEARTARQVGEIFLGYVMPAVSAVAGGISLLSDDGVTLEPYDSRI